MSEIKVNKISPRSGTTVTLGDSGDTIALATGASQTGFGRTGTVNWQTAIKTSTITAVDGEGYFVDTNGGGVTANLPAGSAGAIVAFKDYRNTFDTNALTVVPNGTDKIGGVNANVSFSVESQSVTLIFTDSTRGWLDIHDSTTAATGNAFIVASGGTESTSGDDKIHTFTGPGTFTVSAVAQCAANNLISHLMIGGGGGGQSTRGGGGGAGGFREVKSPTTPYTASPLDGYPSAPNRVTVTAQAYPIVVGGGGVGGSQTPTVLNTNGNNTTFAGLAAAGGGRGGGPEGGGTLQGGAGGSGGGSYSPSSAGTGNTPPTTPAQGNDGGTGAAAPKYGAGGGGGAGAVGSNGSGTAGGNGGNGVSTEITASAITRAGGGGGGAYTTASVGSGGSGGGGDASPGAGTPYVGGNGTDNTGGGGGGNSNLSPGAPGPGGAGGVGGSGIVVIRYKIQ